MIIKALLATKEAGRVSTGLAELEEKVLMPGDVAIAVDCSTVNYKDGVALTEYNFFGPKIGFDIFRFGRRLDR